jgi:lipopolysaccharide export system protein LptA
MILAIVLSVLPAVAFGQGANVALGGLAFDNSAPIEVSADNLSVDPEDGSAVFEGNVVVAQGELRLAANLIRVEYATDEEGNQTPSIGRVSASGGVTFVNGADAAEASEAVYSVEDSSLVLSGDVLLTQGSNIVSGDRLYVDLAAGTGRIEGGVRTIFQAGEN